MPRNRRIALVGALVAIMVSAAASPTLKERSIAPNVVVREHKIVTGQIVRLPVQGDQCWDVPQPCTFHLRSDLAINEENGRLVIRRTGGVQ